MNANTGTNGHDDELESRLRRLEGEGLHDMVQPSLPVGDVAWLVVALVVVSVLLGWWAR